MEGVLTLLYDTLLEPRTIRSDQGQLCPTTGNHKDDSQEVQWLKLLLTHGSHNLILFPKMSRAQAFIFFTRHGAGGASWSLEVSWLCAMLPAPEDGHVVESWSVVPVPMQRPRAGHTPCREVQSR